MRILVTGHKGFIGSHIAETLIAEGHEVWGLDSGVSNVNYAPAGMTGAKHNSLEELTTIPRGTEVIVHCAARADISANWTNAIERQRLWTSNLEGTINLLEAAGDARVVFLSTLAVYGDKECLEGDACEATSPYAASKLAGEALIQAYAFYNHTPWVALRLGAVVGARYHHGHIADFCNMHKLLGAIHSRSSGAKRKPAVHVLDVCDAVSLAVRGHLGFGVFNVATGAWSPRDTVQAMGVEDSAVWPENDRGWVGDPSPPHCSSQRLRSMGWHPYHNIEAGVREAFQSLGWPYGGR